MTMPPLPPLGSTDWYDWAAAAHAAAAAVTTGRLSDAELRAAFGLQAGRTRSAAVADGSDQSAVLQAEVDVLKVAGGGVLELPGGAIVCASSLDLSDIRGIALVGVGSKSDPNDSTAPSPTTLTYTGTGSGAFIVATGTMGFEMRDVAVRHTSTGFTGRLVDQRSSSRATYTRVKFGGSAGVETSICIDLDACHTVHFNECEFGFYDIAVSGQDPAGGDYSLAISFDGCFFARGNTTSIRDGGAAWLFQSCTFNNHTSGAGGHYSAHRGTALVQSVSFVGCWFGDVTAGTAAQIENNALVLTVQGCTIGIGGGTAIKYVRASTRGTFVVGNRIQGAGSGTFIDFNGLGSHTGFVVTGNSLGGTIGTRFVNGEPPSSALYEDDSSRLTTRGLRVRRSSTGGVHYLEFVDRNDKVRARFEETNASLDFYDSSDVLRVRVAGGSILGLGGTTAFGSSSANQVDFRTNNTRRGFISAGGTWVFETSLNHTGTTVGFYGATPVAKAASPGAATGTDAAVINAIVTALRNLGLVT